LPPSRKKASFAAPAQGLLRCYHSEARVKQAAAALRAVGPGGLAKTKAMSWRMEPLFHSRGSLYFEGGRHLHTAPLGPGPSTKPAGVCGVGEGWRRREFIVWGPYTKTGHQQTLQSSPFNRSIQGQGDFWARAAQRCSFVFGASVNRLDETRT